MEGALALAEARTLEGALAEALAEALEEARILEGALGLLALAAQRLL